MYGLCTKKCGGRATLLDVGIRALPRGSFAGTFGHGHVADVLLVVMDAIAVPMAAPYISALYDCCGPTTRARMGRVPLITAAPPAWYSEPAISTVWRLPSEYRDVPSGYF